MIYLGKLNLNYDYINGKLAKMLISLKILSLCDKMKWEKSQISINPMVLASSMGFYLFNFKLMDNWWIKIYRCLLEKGYYKDSEFIHLWVHLLLKANHEDKEFLFNWKIQICKRWQLITWILSIAKETWINRRKIERWLKLFESVKQIVKQSNNKFSLITVINYDEFQESGKQNVKPVWSKCEASGNKQEYKNIRIEEYNSHDEIINFFNALSWRKITLSKQHKRCIDKAFENWYSVEDIKTAFENISKDEWWSKTWAWKDFVPMFRERNSKQEPVDYISKFKDWRIAKAIEIDYFSEFKRLWLRDFMDLYPKYDVELLNNNF